MRNLIVSSMCLAGLAMFSQGGSFSQVSDLPNDGKKVTYFCPVAGMPEAKSCCCPGGYCPRMPTEKHTIEYKGAKLQLCCSQCAKIFKENPTKFAAVANHQLVATKQAMQHKCPLCGSEIAYIGGVDVAGISVGFCSGRCHKKVADASATERVNLVFGDPAFARGFVMKDAKK
jgi:hypothetical protein